MKPAEKLINLNYHRLLLGILEVTLEDMLDERQLKGKNSRREQALNKAESLSFMRGEWFETICDATGIPACQFRKKCLS
jgi:hypothetical protein